MLAGIVSLVVLPPSIRVATRLLLAWDLTAAIYVAFAFLMIARSDGRDLPRPGRALRRKRLGDRDRRGRQRRRRASRRSSSSWPRSSPARRPRCRPGHDRRHGGAVLDLHPHLFTLHYANIYYRPHKHGPPGGLDFPGEHAPDYRDFLYYSFVIGCAAQTADVDTTSRDMRMVSLVHGVVAFAFNTAILALTINVGASLL